MSSIDIAARQWAIELEDRERMRSGVPLPVARRTVARRLNIAPGTLDGLRRGRGKGMRAWLVERLQAAIIAELQHEIGRLEHALQMARQCGMDTRESEVCAAETQLAALHELIEQRS